MGAQPRRPDRDEMLQLQASAKQRQAWIEITVSGILVTMMYFSLIIYHSETNCGHFKTWLKGSCGIYIADLIIQMNQLMHIKKRYRDNLWLLLAQMIVLVINTSWYIYGNVTYFQNDVVCTTPENPDANVNLANCMWFMIMVGYITICKCCLISVFACVAVPYVIREYRRATQPQWEGLDPKLAKDLHTRKYQQRPDAKSGDLEDQCIICMVDYTEEDKIITLPCDTRHVFHEQCIRTWLKKNNTCPLCKIPITKENLQQQARQSRNN